MVSRSTWLSNLQVKIQVVMVLYVMHVRFRAANAILRIEFLFTVNTSCSIAAHSALNQMVEILQTRFSDALPRTRSFPIQRSLWLQWIVEYNWQYFIFSLCNGLVTSVITKISGFISRHKTNHKSSWLHTCPDYSMIAMFYRPCLLSYLFRQFEVRFSHFKIPTVTALGP